MKIIINKIIPIKGYIAIAIWPFIFARRPISNVIVNHETIHGEQQKELLLVLFYIIYCIEYIIKLVITFNHNKAYKSISFEQEANYNEHKLDYISNRHHYTWIKYIFKLWKF